MMFEYVRLARVAVKERTNPIIKACDEIKLNIFLATEACEANARRMTPRTISASRIATLIDKRSVTGCGRGSQHR